MGAASSSRMALSALAVAIAVIAVVPATSGAAVADVFGGDVSCAAQPSAGDVRLCSGPTTTWDGQTKIDVNVVLPPEPPAAADGPYPAIGVFHGWGGSKVGLEARSRGWAEEGYVVFSMSARGWGNSCGAMDPDRIPLSPKCAEGYNHLMDTRFEVRDAQHLLSVLADEGLVQPRRIGATGVSYGGGLSMALAALRDRVMLPDGSLAPWTSPGGTPMEVAAAVPQWPWTDLAYSLMPNGTTLDYVADAPYLGANGKAPIGVMKGSYVTALYALGQALSNYAPPGSDPDADLVKWFALVSAGEPYDPNPLARDIVDEVTSHHSSYYLDDSQAPAPLLIQSGWNDDLFPVNEAIRFYNRTRTEHPGTPIALFLNDDGHMRSQSKSADLAAFAARRDAWFDHYLKEAGPPPVPGVEALTTSCGVASEGPYAAPSWRELAPGEIRLQSAAAQTVAPVAGDPTIGVAYDPVGGGGACAAASGADQPGAASYRLAPAPAAGFTLIGSPTVVADIDAALPTSQLAARLLDVAPSGDATLVSRGLMRPGVGGERLVFQLQPQAYRFAPGHVAKLELLPADAPYGRPSNMQAPVSLSNLELRLPVLEAPGGLEGLAQSPAPKVLPPGYALARDYEGEETVEGGELEVGEEAAPAGAGSGEQPAGPSAIPLRPGFLGLARGRLVATQRSILVRLRCIGPAVCTGELSIEVGRRTAARDEYAVAPESVERVAIALTRAGERLVASRSRDGARRTVRARLEFSGSVPSAPGPRSRAVRLPR